MNTRKRYTDSLLAALCIISWFYISFRTLRHIKDDSAVLIFLWTSIIAIAVGIVGGIVLVLLAILKKRAIRNSFAYNFFGTWNLLIGLSGLLWPWVNDRPTPYIAAAALTVGLVIYKHIYSAGTIFPSANK